MTVTPGSVAPTAPEPLLVARFGLTERALHWVHATAFFGMLATGLMLYLPSLGTQFGSRPLVKAIHIAIALGWMTVVVAIAVAGDRDALRATRREIERFSDDDLRWLRGTHVPQGRFNAGQKVHAIVQAALAFLLVVSGVLLWLGERNTSFRFPGTIALHDGAMYLAVVLVAGHLFLAVAWPATRPALSGMVRGTVRAEWALVHHARWRPPPARREFAASRRACLAAVVVLLAGIAITVAVVRDVL